MENEMITSNVLWSMDEKNELINWLQNRGLIADMYKCGVCGRDMNFVKKDCQDGYVWRCRGNFVNKHDVKRSVRKGSWFEKSKLKMVQVLVLTNMWCARLPTEYMMSEARVNTNAVVDWRRFCREVCVELMERENEMLGGVGVIVEIDKSKFRKRKYHRGKHVDGRWVFGGIERGTNKCFMVVVNERSKEVFLNIIKKYIKPGTTIISDNWKAYDCLNNEGYVHQNLNLSMNFKDPETGAHTISFEGTWAAIKRGMKNGNHCINDIDSDLFEYMWRRNIKGQNVFLKFVEGIKEIYPPSTED